MGKLMMMRPPKIAERMVVPEQNGARNQAVTKRLFVSSGRGGERWTPQEGLAGGGRTTRACGIK